jgi:hypothetical protein
MMVASDMVLSMHLHVYTCDVHGEGPTVSDIPPHDLAEISAIKASLVAWHHCRTQLWFICKPEVLVQDNSDTAHLHCT